MCLPCYFLYVNLTRNINHRYFNFLFDFSSLNMSLICSYLLSIFSLVTLKKFIKCDCDLYENFVKCYIMPSSRSWNYNIRIIACIIVPCLYYAIYTDLFTLQLSDNVLSFSNLQSNITVAVACKHILKGASSYQLGMCQWSI